MEHMTNNDENSSFEKWKGAFTMAELIYMKNGDYLIPDLILDDENEMEEYPLGKYGMLREMMLYK